jgi:TP901 family phage tail tape measure protein
MAVKDVKFILSFDDKGTAILKKATSEGVKTLGQFSGKAKDAEQALRGLAKQGETSGKGMSKLKGMLKSTWGQMAIGMGVMTGVTGLFRTVSRTMSSVITTGREFQRSWANTTTMLTEVDGKIEHTNMTFDDMRDQLMNLSPMLGGPKSLSDGLYQVLSASVDAGKAIGFLATASKSAQAGATDVATSVDALTTVYNAYGKEAYNVNQISDIMFQTVKRGKLTYETLAGAIGTVVPIASQVGVSFEEVAGAMATMTRQGIDVNTSTMALRQTLVSVLKPTKDAMQVAEDLGIAFDSASLAQMGFAEWLAHVNEKAGDNADAMAALFGNVRALMGVFALAGDKIEEFTSDVTLMEQAVLDGTATQEAFEKQLRNADAMLRVLKTILDKMKIAIWEGLAKPFQGAIADTENVTEVLAELQRKAIEFGTKLGEAIGKAIKFLVDFRGVILTVAKVLGAFWALKKVNSWATGMSTALVNVAGKFKVFSGAVAGQGPMILKAFNVIKVGVGALGKTLVGLVASTGPVGLVIAGVTALGVGAYMLIKHWDKVKQFFVNLWTNIKAIFAGAVNAISNMLPDWAKKALGIMLMPWKMTLKLIKPIVTAIIKVAGFLGKNIFGAFKKYGEAVIKFWVGVFNKIKEAVTGVVNFIKKLQFWKKFKKDFKEGFDAVKNEAKSTTVVVSEETKKWAKHFIESGEGAKLAEKMFGGFIKLGKKLKPTTKDVVSSLDKQVKALDELYKTGKIGNKETINRMKELVTKYKDAGKQVPESLLKIGDAIDENVAKVKKAQENWRDLLDEYRKVVPNTRNVNTQTKALTTVIKGYVDKGADATTTTKLFETQINKLYAEALLAKKMFGTEIPEALEKMKGQVDDSHNKTAVLQSKFKDLNDVLKKAPGEMKNVEKGFMGIDAEGNKVFMSMTQVQQTAKALGVTFKTDLRKQLANLEQGFEDVMTTGDVLEEDQAQMIQQIVSMYQKLGIDVPEKYEDMMKELVDKTKKGRGDITDDLEKLGQLTGILGDAVGGEFGSIITTVGVGIQQAAQAVKNGVSGLGNVLGSISPLLGQLGGQIGSFISKQKDNFASLGSAIGGTIGGIFGPLGKAIGALAGGLLGGLVGKKKKKTEEQRLLEQFNMQVQEAKDAMKKFGDITDETAKAIAETRKEYDGWVAEAIHFGDVMKDVGITQDKLNDMWEQAHGLISAYEQGLVDNALASEKLGEQFTMLLQGAQDFGMEGSKAMVDFINRVKESGLQVAEVTDYINEQLGIVPQNAMSASEGLLAMAEMLPIDKFQKWKDKQQEIMDQMSEIKNKGSKEYQALQKELDGVNNKLENITGNTQRQLKTLESQAMSVFNAMIANGASYQEAMNSIGPTLDQIIQAQTDMGIEGGEAIQELLKIREVQNEHKNLFNAIDGNLAVLNALGNTGSLTQQAMMDAGKQTNQYYKKLMKAGLDSNQALTQMAPTLQQLRFYAEEHGLEIDKATQKLIDQAEASGLLEDKQLETVDVMMAGFGMIIQALGGDIPDAMQQSIDKMNEFDQSGKDTTDTMNDLEHSIHGSGVTGAMAELDKRRVKVMGQFQQQANKLGVSFQKIEGNLGSLEKTSSGAFKHINKELNNMYKTLDANAKKAKELEKSVKGSGIHGAVVDLGKANKDTFGKMERELVKTGTIGKQQFALMKDEYKKSLTEMEHASMLAPGFVGPPKQRHLAVDPATVGAGARVFPEEAGEKKPIEINLKPVVVPWRAGEGFLIKFIQEGTEDERIKINAKSLRYND